MSTPTIILEFKDEKTTLGIRADHVAGLVRMTADGPRHYTAVKPIQSPIIGFSSQWHIFDSDEDFKHNYDLWMGAVARKAGG